MTEIKPALTHEISAEVERMVQQYACLPNVDVLPQSVRDAAKLARLVLLQRSFSLVAAVSPADDWTEEDERAVDTYANDRSVPFGHSSRVIRKFARRLQALRMGVDGRASP